MRPIKFFALYLLMICVMTKCVYDNKAASGADGVGFNAGINTGSSSTTIMRRPNGSIYGYTTVYKAFDTQTTTVRDIYGRVYMYGTGPIDSPTVMYPRAMGHNDRINPKDIDARIRQTAIELGVPAKEIPNIRKPLGPNGPIK